MWYLYDFIYNAYVGIGRMNGVICVNLLFGFCMYYCSFWKEKLFFNMSLCMKKNALKALFSTAINKKLVLNGVQLHLKRKKFCFKRS